MMSETADWLAYWITTDSSPEGCRAVETADWRVERWGTDVLFCYEIVEDRWEESHWYKYTDVLRRGDRAPRREVGSCPSRD